jgi:stage II sporulation protein D
MKAGEDAECHVTTTTSSQVYEEGSVPEIIREAVDETSGQVITYDDEVACAYFFSTSGGHTESSENVWSGKLGYLRGVEDSYEPEIANNTNWSVTYTRAELKKMFPSLGTITDIEITELSENDRVTELVITGSKGSKTLTKNSIRTPFGTSKLKSQWFEVYFEDGEATFEGHGFGHGVGMSQYGAMGMAAEGFTYDEILKWYYTDIEILGFDEYNKDEEDYDAEQTDIYTTPILEALVEICSTNWLKLMLNID